MSLSSCSMTPFGFTISKNFLFISLSAGTLLINSLNFIFSSLLFWNTYSLRRECWVNNFFSLVFKDVKSVGFGLHSLDKYSGIILIFLLLYVMFLFSLASLKIFSLSLVFITFTLTCLGVVWLCCILVFIFINILWVFKFVVQSLTSLRGGGIRRQFTLQMYLLPNFLCVLPLELYIHQRTQCCADFKFNYVYYSFIFFLFIFQLG